MGISDDRRRYHYIVTIRESFKLNKTRVNAICEYYKERIEMELIHFDALVKTVVFEEKNVIGKPHIHIVFECDHDSPLDSMSDTIDRINLNLSKHMVYHNLKDYDNQPILYLNNAGGMCKQYGKDSCPGRRDCNLTTPLHPYLLKCQMASILIPCTEYVKHPKEGQLIINNTRHIKNLSKYLERKEDSPNSLYYFNADKAE